MSPLPWRRIAWGLAAVAPAAALAAACGTDAAAPAPVDAGVDAAATVWRDAGGLAGLTPSHGPFRGGTRARLDGRGLSSRLVVLVGGVEVRPGDVVTSDPGHAAILTPGGPPGPAEVRVRDVGTGREETLAAGFVYDPFVVTPAVGAPSGGTRLTLEGSGTAWGPATTVAIAGAACLDVRVTAPTSLACTTPAGTPGAKDVVVDGVQVREAFTYADGVDGYRGGLGGGPLLDRLRVTARDGATGLPIAGAVIVLGDDVTHAARTGPGGGTELSGLAGAPITVTVAAPCYAPRTWAAVPVDAVLAYLDRVPEVACALGDPSPPIATGATGGKVEGELLFPVDGAPDQHASTFTRVPAPLRPAERRVAYVFEAGDDPAAPFALPPASAAITEGARGANGFAYSVAAGAGNATVYALAGLEDRSVRPPSFVPWVMGIARGVPVPVRGRATGVDLVMDVPLDHAVTLAAAPPSTGPGGPDRFAATLAVSLGAGRFALSPLGAQTSLLPLPGALVLGGAPALTAALAGEDYVVGGRFATGPGLGLPRSAIDRVRTTGASAPLGPFLDVPVLLEPSGAVWDGARVRWSAAAGFDLAVVRVTAGARTWTIAAPGGTTEVVLPALDAVPDGAGLGLPRGPITTRVVVARLDAFTYASLRDGQLAPSAWSAHAAAAFEGVH